ncbi:hypothetical protein Hanom_Chr10g00931351 [Helianthus anomalus]
MQVIYHKNIEESPRLKQIEDNYEKEKSRACVVIQDDEGYDWSQVHPKEDAVGYTFTAHGRTISSNKHLAFVAEIKEKMREEILKEKTYRERCIIGYRIEEMEKEYEEARNYGRYDKKRECYINRKGEPVVHRKEVVFDDILAIIPLSGEYYSNVAKDKHYEKNMDKLISDVMTTSLKRGMQKVAEEEREKEKEDEAVVEEAVTEEQQNEDDLKKKGEDDVKIESSVEVDDGAGVGEELKKNEADQTQTKEKNEVPITEVNTSTDAEVINKTVEQCQKCMEMCSTCTEKDKKILEQEI